MALSMTFLQGLTLILGTASAYLLARMKPTWWIYIISFVITFPISWFSGVVIWAYFFVPENYTSAIASGMSRSFLFAVAGPILGIMVSGKYKRVSTNESQRANGVTGKAESINSEADIKFYELAWAEIESGNTKKSIWAQSFAKTEGDINKTKAAYLKLRVKELKQEEEVRIEKEVQEKIINLKNRTESELMADYGISYDGAFYHFDEYKYSNLQDAINYAEKVFSNNNR